MEKKLKIGLDIDDVVLHFNLHAHKFFGHVMEKCDYWCVKTMDEKFGKGWFMEKIVPNAEFWETQPMLSRPEDIDFEVAYYISAFPEEHRDRRVNLLKKYGFPDAPLIIAYDKLAKCIELGVDVLVDDKADTIRKLQGSPVRGIHFLNEYAGFEPVGTFITNLNQLKNYL